jgi:hypothetical protein
VQTSSCLKKPLSETIVINETKSANCVKDERRLSYSPNRTNVATDFRAGNVSPDTDNLGFIKTCQDALPKGTNIKKT